MDSTLSLKNKAQETSFSTSLHGPTSLPEQFYRMGAKNQAVSLSLLTLFSQCLSLKGKLCTILRAKKTITIYIYKRAKACCAKISISEQVCLSHIECRVQHSEKVCA